jgi:hypothetical protein
MDKGGEGESMSTVAAVGIVCALAGYWFGKRVWYKRGIEAFWLGRE